MEKLGKSGFPSLEMSLKNIAVNTKNTKEFNGLMRIFEIAGGITWRGGNETPIQGSSSIDSIMSYGKNTCVHLSEGKLAYAPKGHFQYEMPFEAFCHMIGAGYDKLEQINEWFADE